MPGRIAPALRAQIVRYLLRAWRPDAIAKAVGCGVSTVYLIQANLSIYGSPFRPQSRPKGCPRKITKAVEETLIEYINESPWALQKEMAWFLWEEWGASIHYFSSSFEDTN